MLEQKDQSEGNLGRLQSLEEILIGVTTSESQLIPQIGWRCNISIQLLFTTSVL